MTDGEQRQIAVAQWLAQQGKREELDAESLAEVQTLFKPHKGFGILWSMLMYERTIWQTELTNVALGTEQGRAHGSVLQGQIKAVDRLYEMLLDIASPTVQDLRMEN